MTAFKCIFFWGGGKNYAKIVSKFWKSYLTRLSQEPILVLSVISVLLHHNTVTNVDQIAAEVLYLSHW